MKKLFTRLGVSAIMISALTFTAVAQKDNKNHQKEKQHNKGNKEDKHDKHNNSDQDHGQSSIKINKQDKHDNNKNDQKFSKWEKKENKGQQKNRNNNGNNGIASNNNRKNDKDGWGWNDETFKERKKLRNQAKVTICHKINNNKEQGVAISVSANAVKAHMKHGDAMGGCPVVKNSSFSSAYLTKRTDYYNTLQKSQEQVLYSQSILDYAIARLTNSRWQLTTLKANNMPVVEIERKQATVVELEQNVSLLETLIGATASYVVSKL